jgi:hypothetical protein
MQQFLAGWQMGQDRIANQRQAQMMQMRQEQEAYQRQQDLIETKMREEQLKIQKQRIDAEAKAARLEAAQKEHDLRTQAQYLQGMPAPTAAEVGVPQQSPEMAGPSPDQINVPQPTMAMPSPTGGEDIQMPVLTGRQQQEMALAEQQRKMRDALGMLQLQQEARLPYELAREERQAKAAEEREGRAEARIAAREDRSQGKQSLAQENRLRAEYNRESKKLRDGLNDLDRFSAPVRKSIESGKQPSPADQFALIYAFNKALDPNSVVRESEFKNTQGVGAGVTDQAFLMLQRWRRGEQLAPAQITQMMETIQRARGATEDSLGQIGSQYMELAASYGVDPEKVVVLGGKATGGDSGGWETVGGVRVRKKARP